MLHRQMSLRDQPKSENDLYRPGDLCTRSNLPCHFPKRFGGIIWLVPHRSYVLIMLFIDRLYEEENGVRPLFYYRARDDCGLTEIVPYENEEVVTLSEDVRKKYPQAKLLTDLLCLPKSYGLYEIYDTYFEGKINNDEDMISNIVEGLLKEKGIEDRKSVV